MSEQTDLDITRKCAEAMYGGYVDFGAGANTQNGYEESGNVILVADVGQTSCNTPYDPLQDDAQAMALVKKLGLHLLKHTGSDNWAVSQDWTLSAACISSDLNRAICQCVANLPV